VPLPLELADEAAPPVPLPLELADEVAPPVPLPLLDEAPPVPLLLLVDAAAPPVPPLLELADAAAPPVPAEPVPEPWVHPVATSAAARVAGNKRLRGIGRQEGSGWEARAVLSWRGMVAAWGKHRTAREPWDPAASSRARWIV
jgi:hypothetical protein